VASSLTTVSAARDMIEALIAGGAQPEGSRRAGPEPDAGQARRPNRGAHRAVR
jgi:hypothetical protein